MFSAKYFGTWDEIFSANVRCIFSLPPTEELGAKLCINVGETEVEQQLSKAEGNMLVKLTPGFNFINILQAVFMCTDTERAKKDCKVKQLFVLLGSLSVKAACQTLVKLTPEKEIFRILILKPGFFSFQVKAKMNVT